ncbi:MAG: helix-turn-helix domain-containing protein [Phocaeicola sp.]|nr:helix-turn-helix domain-containing protein [Phocaeicola sp.]
MRSSGKSASEIAKIFDVTIPTVYAWIKRYKENGIKGLETHPGQGRKPIMDFSDDEAVRKAIEEDRQSAHTHANPGKKLQAKKPATLPLNVF